MTYEEWQAEGTRRFGEDRSKWKFICPSCGYVASVQDWKDANASEGAVAFSCIGRFLDSDKEMGTKDGGPCNYAGGGLFALNPIKIVQEEGESRIFDFAPE